jgi:hypothetical protein
MSDAGRVIHGYKHTDVTCPHCGGNYGMLETTDDPKVMLYRCWCGATAKGTDDDPYEHQIEERRDLYSRGFWEY